MIKKFSIILIGILILFTVLLLIYVTSNTQSTQRTLPPHLVKSLFSKEADGFFISTVAHNTDLNSGITLERATPASPDKNITFAVFNHTSEPIEFPNQAFGLAIFRYDDTNKLWERLQLQYTPYHELQTLPPKLEKWDFEIGNNWVIPEDEVMTWKYDQIRLYVSGTGQVTNKTYGAFLDVTISTSP